MSDNKTTFCKWIVKIQMEKNIVLSYAVNVGLTTVYFLHKMVTVSGKIHFSAKVENLYSWLQLFDWYVL